VNICLYTPLLCLAATTGSPPPVDDDEAITKRCLVIFDGRHELCGECTAQHDGGLTVVDEDGESHQLTQSRIVFTQWLLDVPAPAEGVVELTDGRQLRGLIKSDTCSGVEMTLHGVPLLLERQTVASAWFLEPVETRYQQLKPLMPINRSEAHLSLCRWLVEEQAWDLAVAELEAHVEQHRSVEATRLLRVARAHAKLLDAPDRNPDSPKETDNSSAHTEPASVDARAVNLVRVFEIDLANPPDISIAPEVRQAFLNAYQQSALLPQSEEGRQTLLNGPAIDLLKQMFSHRAREFYGSVRVLSEPVAMRRFRESVHDQWLLPRCASTSCHGGPDAGRFRLLRGRRLDDGIRTSNLLILNSLTLDGQPMIDWNTPTKSMLIQSALPRAVATHPHPAVDGWRPTLDTLDGPRTMATIRWIESMMRSPRPSYPVEPPTFPKTPPSGPRLPR